MSTPEPQSKRRKKTSVSRNTTQSNPVKNNSEKHSDIQVAAYYKAQARGFVAGYELDDWLAAEKEAKQ